MLLNTGAMSPLYWFLEILAIAAFVCEVWGFVDALRRPSKAFVAAGKQTKPLWLIILGVAAVIGLYLGVLSGGFGAVGILPIAAFVASAIYLTDVRPKVRESRRASRYGPGSSSGPGTGPGGNYLSETRGAPTGSNSTTSRSASGTRSCSRPARTGSCWTPRPSTPAAVASHPTTGCCCGAACRPGSWAPARVTTCT